MFPPALPDALVANPQDHPMKDQSIKRPPKLTDAERHKRFVDMAKEVEASETEKDFEHAFKRVVHPGNPRSQSASAKDDKNGRR